MTFSRILFWISRFFQYSLTVLWGSLQFVDAPGTDIPKSLKEYLLVLAFHNKLNISIVLGLLIMLATLIADRQAQPQTVSKQYRQDIMEVMLTEIFDNDKKHIRVSIFKDINLFRRICIYLKHFFVNSFKTWRNFDNYVAVWDRLGHEFPDSRTYLKFNDKTAKDGCEGIAGLVRKLEDPLLRENLPNIEDIDLDEAFAHQNTKRWKRVKEYMERGNVNDIATLKRLNRKARHFYGTVIRNRNGEVKGVLVIDSLNEISPFTDDVIKEIPYYLRLISTAI